MFQMKSFFPLCSFNRTSYGIDNFTLVKLTSSYLCIGLSWYGTIGDLLFGPVKASGYEK